MSFFCTVGCTHDPHPHAFINIRIGVPGVGKTLTAETLATVLKRRLLRIDASDFRYGDTAQVSNTFTSYFRMAHSWGSILLLSVRPFRSSRIIECNANDNSDEADVFLQNRERDEIKQNALVSGVSSTNSV